MAQVQHIGLTTREREIARLVELNLSNDEIARQLGIKSGTIKIHVHNILKKRGKISIKHGLIPRPRRSGVGATTAAGIERIRAAQRRRGERWRAARSNPPRRP